MQDELTVTRQMRRDHLWTGAIGKVWNWIYNLIFGCINIIFKYFATHFYATNIYASCNLVSIKNNNQNHLTIRIMFKKHKSYFISKNQQGTQAHRDE